MSKHLQREIDSLKREILSLSAIVEEGLEQVALALRTRDTALAQHVINRDVEIDEREVDIEEECCKILALHQPVANDLRFIIAVLKINNELERIGDTNVNIAERVLFLSECSPVRVQLDFQPMARAASDMLSRSLDALVNESPQLAGEVIASDDYVDAMNRDMYTQVKEGIRNSADDLEALIHYLGVARHLERIADHAVNIAEDVIYMIDGRIVRHRAEEFAPRVSRS